jgi:hypothetical protein
MSGTWEGCGLDSEETWGDGQTVEVRYPLADLELPGDLPDDEQMALMRADRGTWPWLPGEIVLQCGPDEWEVVVCDERLAQLEDGSPAPAGTRPEDLFYPTCYRDVGEIREPFAEAETALAEPTSLAAADPVLDVTVVQQGELSAEWLRAPDWEAGQ